MKVTPFLGQAPLFIAIEEGLFAAAGVGMETASPQLGRMANDLVALGRGELDVVNQRLSAGVLNAVARGARIRIVASRGTFLPGDCSAASLVTRPGLDPSVLDDRSRLLGLRVQMAPATFDEYLLDLALSPFSLTARDLDTIRVPPHTRPEARQRGQFDLGPEPEPWLTRNLRQGAEIWKTYEELAPDFSYTYIFFGPRLIEDDVELGARFLSAYLRAIDLYGRGKTDRNVEIIARYTGLDEELVREACWPRFRPSGAVEWEDLLAFQRWAVERGYQDRLLAAEDLWDPRPLARAGSRGSGD